MASHAVPAGAAARDGRAAGFLNTCWKERTAVGAISAGGCEAMSDRDRLTRRSNDQVR